MLSLYWPGTSIIHRTYAWIKVALLCICGTVVMLISSIPILIGAVLAVIILYAIARIPGHIIWRMTRAILVFLVLIAGFQWLFTSGFMAVVVSLRILFLIATANLLTLTTPMSALITSVESALKPLRRFGIHPERIRIGVGLALRFIPVLVEQGACIREAQAARGVKARFTYLVPLIIRTLRMADGVGEALEVRMTLLPDDWTPPQAGDRVG